MGRRQDRSSAAAHALTSRGLPRKVDLPGAAGYKTTAQRTLSEALATEVREHAETKKGERMTFLQWTRKVPEPKAGQLDWDRFPFQKELYTQASAAEREIVVKKPTQVGISAYMLRWAMYWCDMRGATALYVFPKLKQMFDFSDARVKAVINASEYLRSRIPPGYTTNKGLKQIGFGWCYFRGSESEDDLDSVDADVVCLDEYDRLHPPNIPVAERRISGPQSMALMRRIGVPTIPNFGISRLYEKSDQRRWHVKCGHCNEIQFLTWNDNMDLVLAIRVCRKCRKELTPDMIRGGEWLPTFPERDAIGYQMSKLIVPDAKENALKGLVDNSEKTLPEDRQAFWNRDLGEAYAPSEGRLSEEAIYAACTAGGQAGAQCSGSIAASFNLVTMGVDVASVRNLNVRISEHLQGRRKRAVFLGTVANFDDLDRLMEEYGVHMATIDHLPEGRSSRAFAERWPGKVYLVSYAQNAQRVIQINNGERRVNVRRVEAIDAMMQMIREQRNLLPPQPPPHYTEHLQALIRVAEKDQSGRKKVRYESTGADDYAHAEVYDLVASELFWMRQNIDALEREELSTLEDHMDFDRSILHEDADRYVAGPGDEAYEPGLPDY